MEKDIKEYVIGSFSKGNTTMSDPNHEYMFFEVIPNADMVRKFKEEFIKTLSEPLMYKLICNKIDWIRSSKYITGDNFFEMGLIPLKKSDKYALNMFMNNTSAVVNVNRYKALTVNGNTTYLFVPCKPDKLGRTYQISPVIKISEDIYNIAKISAGQFDMVTLEDLSKYSSFFSVADVPFMIKSEASIERRYRNGLITLDEYRDQLTKYQREERLVKTLRR